MEEKDDDFNKEDHLEIYKKFKCSIYYCLIC